ncbi:MAG: fumarylacetoacetate hydrolase family protein [bacterium]|nr:fumarylacetoacetate hydrolase family protein [bacterium]
MPAILVAVVTVAGCASPPALRCVDMDARGGRLLPLGLSPARVYGIGLSYAGHAGETGLRRRARTGPPVFEKGPSSLNAMGRPVRMPSRAELIDALERLEPGLGRRADREFADLPALLDYEAELAFVLLEDVDWRRIDERAYAPRMGFFIANDLSARSVAVLGEGRPDRDAFWGASKSFRGFMPVGPTMWVPDALSLDAVVCVILTTEVNGEVRQRDSTGRLLYTPRRMLKAVAARFPDDLPAEGDVILTGTPAGVALRVPAWKTALADLLGIDRFARLSSVIGMAERSGRFLAPGDEVTVSGGPLGSVTTVIE